MLPLLSESWWAIALRGFIALLFGVMVLIWPGLGLMTLVALFGAFAIFDGAFALAGAFSAVRHKERWWTLALIGVVSIAAGVIALAWPRLTLFALFLVLAVRAIVLGVIEIAMAVRIRKEVKGEWVLAAAGLFSIAFGVLFFVWPYVGAMAVAWLIGAYAVVIGALQIALGFRVHHHGYAVPRVPAV